MRGLGLGVVRLQASYWRCHSASASCRQSARSTAGPCRWPGCCSGRCDLVGHQHCDASGLLDAIEQLLILAAARAVQTCAEHRDDLQHVSGRSSSKVVSSPWLRITTSTFLASPDGEDQLRAKAQQPVSLCVMTGRPIWPSMTASSRRGPFLVVIHARAGRR